MSKIKYLVSRFKQMKQTYIGEQECSFFYVIDYIFAFIIHGASISDYFAYGFYKLRFNGRKEYITYPKFHKIQNVCNPVKQNREICRNKVNFNNRFSSFLGRDWIDISISNLDEFISFINRHDIIFIKEITGYRGIGTTKYITKEIKNPEKLYKDLQADKNTHYIAEEKITQVQELADFHPYSINTIRIVTVYDDVADKVYFMNARLRMGNKKNCVDNFHFDGICANIDIATGVINTIGYDKHNKTYIFHPETGKQIIGSKIPYWSDCKTFAEKAARHIPEVRYVGWDIVIKENGDSILLEGNDNADHDIQQLYNKGLWKEYKAIIKELK